MTLIKPKLEIWKVSSPLIDFSPFETPGIDWRAHVSKPNINIWKIGRFEVIADTVPNFDRIGQTGRVLIGPTKFACALTEVNISSDWLSSQRLATGDYVYMQGQRTVTIEMLILEDRWPPLDTNEMTFEWEIDT